MTREIESGQSLDAKLALKMREAEEARAKSADAWRKIDAVLYSKLPHTEKLGMLSHLRTSNSETGEQWAANAYHAVAMSITPERARRVMAKLTKDGALELLREGGGTLANVVTTNDEWMRAKLQDYLQWQEDRKKSRKTTPVASNQGEPRSAGTPVASNQTPRLPATRPPGCQQPDPPVASNHLSLEVSGHVSADVSGHTRRPSTVNHQPPKVPTASTPLDSKKAGGELQVHPEKSFSDNGGIPWVEVDVMKADWGKARVEQAAYFDRKTGRLALVNNDAGMALYDQLRSDGYPIEVVKSGIAAAAGRAHREITQSGARAGALEGLIRQYCQYALEKAASTQQRSQEPPAYVTYGGGKFQL